MSKNQKAKTKNTVSNPHDCFFRGAMSNPRLALEFLQTHLPPHILEKIDPSSLKLAPGSFIDKELRQWFTDVIYEAAFDSHQGYIYMIIEHQRKAEPLMPLRLFEYMLKIMRTWVKEHHGSTELPIVYPCVIYNGERPYSHTTDFFELFQDPHLGREIFLKPFQLIDLSQIPDDDLKKKPLIGMVEMFLKHARARDAFKLISALGGLIQAVQSRNEIELLQQGFSYLLQTQKEQEPIIEIFQESLSENNQSNIMTIAESLVNKGLQTGLQEGREEGCRSLLIKQLNRRFPNGVTDRHLFLIEEADSATLSEWGENLIDSTSIDELFLS